jgi:hypothetical protein
MNCWPSREVLDCAGKAKRRRRFRIERNVRERVSVQQKSGVGKWNNIFDGSRCEQSDLPPHSKTLTREGQGLGVTSR